MDLFKFRDNPSDPTTLEFGEPINDISGVRWTERYRSSGEFEIKAPVSSGLQTFLPLGTMISHVNTLEVMIVEDHQVSEKANEDPELTVTGRSFESYLENRVIGTEQAFPNPAPPPLEYTLAAGYTWEQAVVLINDHIKMFDTVSWENNLLNVDAITSIVGTGASVVRIPKRGTVYAALLELLAVDDLGIKTVRRNYFSGEDSYQTKFVVHNGVDLRSSVIFSANAGDLDGVDYLWTNRKEKNAALVTGRYVEVFVPGSSAHYNRRIMTVDGSDIDGSFDTVPTGTDLTDIRAKMVIRGQQALSSQNQVNIARVDISESARPQYRTDYNVGDIVTVDANYGAMAARRVVEYVEIEDGKGASGHPTLAAIGD